jgi:hypothetical protein
LEDILRNHADGITAMDLLVVRPDDLISLALWFVNHGAGRRQVLWFGVTAHPTAEWIANLITQARASVSDPAA